MHRFAAIALSLFLSSVGLVAAQEESDQAPVNVHSEVFSKERVESYGYKRFSIDASGYIRNGFRVSRGEPIDYSPLLSDATLAKDFVRSVLGCENCEFPPFYWPEAMLTYHFVVTKEAKTPLFFFKSGEEVYDVFSEAGIKASPERQRDKANLVVFVGDSDFLLRKAREIADQQVIRLYSSGRTDQAPVHSNEAFIAQLFSGTSCTVSLIKREAEGRAYIFTPYEDLEACLSKQLLLVAGLYPFKGNVPSALNLDLNYSEATLADIIFLRAYYYIRKTLNVADEDLQAASEWVFGAADFEKRMNWNL
ncbi:hypothetical protein KUW17_14950 [Leisingera aquaemixtae]|uniref:hypothetical protein n=1 Tax=Leisingera aquaemixtae TaxID=1396826 RepID=UPI001C94CB8B|nr:hypothetical protein [Leisingera aquaemixtae]MBY6068051.1 hypothetical protein [Leisingera aquaemixtae]